MDFLNIPKITFLHSLIKLFQNSFLYFIKSLKTDLLKIAHKKDFIFKSKKSLQLYYIIIKLRLYNINKAYFTFKKILKWSIYEITKHLLENFQK